MNEEQEIGRKIGKWTLLTKIGEGGNAVVFQASDGANDQYALKRLKSTQSDSEPYRRFQREIETLCKLTADGEKGVVPVLHSCLPAKPSRREPAYHVMPLLRPIRAVSESGPLDRVIRLIRQPAQTLARLHERGVAQRFLAAECHFGISTENFLYMQVGYYVARGDPMFPPSVSPTVVWEDAVSVPYNSSRQRVEVARLLSELSSRRTDGVKAFAAYLGKAGSPG